jgi:hypothetical protein
MTIGGAFGQTINSLAEQATTKVKNAPAEIKSAEGKIAVKFDEYNGKSGFNPDTPIVTPAQFQFPTKMKTDLGQRIEKLQDGSQVAMMFPASTKGNGLSMGFPDICKVPAPPAPFAPVPFPNIEQASIVLTALLTGLDGELGKVKDIPEAAELTGKTMLWQLQQGLDRLEGNDNQIKALMTSGTQIFQKTVENLISNGGSISTEEKGKIQIEVEKFEKELKKVLENSNKGLTEIGGNIGAGAGKATGDLKELHETLKNNTKTSRYEDSEGRVGTSTTATDGKDHKAEYRVEDRGQKAHGPSLLPTLAPTAEYSVGTENEQYGVAVELTGDPAVSFLGPQLYITVEKNHKDIVPQLIEDAKSAD